MAIKKWEDITAFNNFPSHIITLPLCVHENSTEPTFIEAFSYGRKKMSQINTVIFIKTLTLSLKLQRSVVKNYQGQSKMMRKTRNVVKPELEKSKMIVLTVEVKNNKPEMLGKSDGVPWSPSELSTAQHSITFHAADSPFC